jgi:hypothetical protein
VPRKRKQLNLRPVGVPLCDVPDVTGIGYSECARAVAEGRLDARRFSPNVVIVTYVSIEEWIESLPKRTEISPKLAKTPNVRKAIERRQLEENPTA